MQTQGDPFDAARRRYAAAAAAAFDARVYEAARTELEAASASCADVGAAISLMAVWRDAVQDAALTSRDGSLACVRHVRCESAFASLLSLLEVAGPVSGRRVAHARATLEACTLLK